MKRFSQLRKQSLLRVRCALVQSVNDAVYLAGVLRHGKESGPKGLK
jgi:hypothetical protein